MPEDLLRLENEENDNPQFGKLYELHRFKSVSVHMMPLIKNAFYVKTMLLDDSVEGDEDDLDGPLKIQENSIIEAAGKHRYSRTTHEKPGPFKTSANSKRNDTGLHNHLQSLNQGFSMENNPGQQLSLQQPLGTLLHSQESAIHQSSYLD